MRLSPFVHGLGATLVAVSVFVYIIAQGVWNTLPDITDPTLWQANQSIVMLDSEGEELYRFYHEADRMDVLLEQVPADLKHAMIAIEDKRFYERGCVDLHATGRALLANIHAYKSQGASTITQQLVRTALLDRSKTLERKFREVMLACQLEQLRSKQEILALYLNWASFGHGITGVQQASKRYFGKDVGDLSLAESAVLAALPQRPTYFSPYGPHRRTSVGEELAADIREGAITDLSQVSEEQYVPGLLGTMVRIGDELQLLPGRANLVLRAMLEQGYITAEQRAQAEEELQTLDFMPLVSLPRAPHFVVSLKEEIDQLMTMQPMVEPSRGLHIHTTINPQMQQIAEEVVENARTLLLSFGTHNVALVAVDLHTNEILAYIGGPDFYDDDIGGQFDMARTPRQTGSVFKPFVYATLLENGFSSESRIADTPFSSGIYHAFKSGYYGWMTIRYALARSRNTPAIRAFYLAGGEDAILALAKSVGITTPSWQKENALREMWRYRYGWALALGAAESSLLEMLQGYSVLARDGHFTPLTAVRRITAADGEELSMPPRKTEQVLASQTAQQLTSILRDEEAREPLWRYSMKLPFGDAAVKTGTSTICGARNYIGACTDLWPNNTWTIGYTDDLLVGVWVGNVDNAPMKKEAWGITTALPIWKEFLIRSYNAHLS